MFKNIKKNIRKAGVAALVLAQVASIGLVMPSMTAGATSITREVENLDRGVVAVKTDGGVFVSWRRLGTEPTDTTFTLYRDNQLVTSGAITNFVDAGGTISSKYKVVTNGATESKTVSVWENQYLDIPLSETPVSVGDPIVDKNGVWFPEYSPGDCAVGDLDGDGEYEIVMIWNPADAKDSATTGYTGIVYIDAYKLDGTQLWRIDMGKNIRAGAHDTQLTVADFNGDGMSEVVIRTADGTKDAAGTVIGDGTKDWAALDSGKNLQGPLYLSAFEGATGKVLDTVDYPAQTEGTGSWGDNYGNRSERYLATIAWVDGVRPYAVHARGYYPNKEGTGQRTCIGVYGMEGSKLVKKWIFDTKDAGEEYTSQGNHSMGAGDLDGDGFDEIIYGSMAIDHDGKVLWNSGYGHGDAHHLGEFDPTNEGYEYLDVYEGAFDAPGYMGARNQTWGLTVQKSATGEVLISHDGIKDTGRGMIGNIGYKDSFYVAWGAGSTGYWTNKDEDCGDLALAMNGRIYWDGGLTDQLQDHVTISKYNNSTNKADVIFTGEGKSINGTKGNVNMQGDLIGDWREEFVCYVVTESKEEQVPVQIQGAAGMVDTTAKKTTSKYALRLYTTVIPTEYNFSTFMHDDLYRIGVATYNVAYNQPPHISFYISDTVDGYKTQPTPNVKLVGSYTEAAFDSSSVSGEVPVTTPTPVATPTPGSDDVKFTDVDGHWAKEFIVEMFKAGIINGMDETTFAPDASVTKGQFVKLIVAALDMTPADTASSGHWAVPYVNVAKDVNLINDAITVATDADLDTPITREEMASVVTKAAVYKAVEATAVETSFTDNDAISTWAVEDVKTAVSLGIVKGMDDNSFQPQAGATRAQAATMMSRLLGLIK